MNIVNMIWGAVMESRFEPMLAELECIITDYRTLRRQAGKVGQVTRTIQALQRQLRLLEEENELLRHRQQQVCTRLADLLLQVERWEGEEQHG